MKTRVVMLMLCGAAVLCGCGRESAAPGTQAEEPQPGGLLDIAGTIQEDPAAAQQRCDGGESQVCALLGMYYLEHEHDADRALPLGQQGCEGGAGMGCTVAGMVHAQREVPDYAAARTFLDQACTLRDAAGCYNLGVMHHYGHGVPKDTGRAAELYAEACGMKAGVACYNLGLMHAAGEGRAVDHEQAATLYGRACELGSSEGCFSLGMMYFSGQGVRRSFENARSLFLNACDLGNHDGCDAYQQLKDAVEGTEVRLGRGGDRDVIGEQPGQ